MVTKLPTWRQIMEALDPRDLDKPALVVVTHSGLAFPIDLPERMNNGDVVASTLARPAVWDAGGPCVICGGPHWTQGCPHFQDAPRPITRKYSHTFSGGICVHCHCGYGSDKHVESPFEYPAMPNIGE